MASLGRSRVTSASTRKVTVSDQSRTITVMVRPGLGVAPVSILVKGHGPAMQDTRAFLNCCPWPASMVTPPTAAFHWPFGEQGGCPAQGTLPALVTVNVLAVLPTLTELKVFSAYRMRTSLMAISCAPGGAAACAGTGIIRTTYRSPAISARGGGARSIG